MPGTNRPPTGQVFGGGSGLALPTGGEGLFFFQLAILAPGAFDSGPNSDGSFVRRLESDRFASPWGVVLAPDDGEFSNALLIGNFNDEFGFINAFDSATGEFSWHDAECRWRPAHHPVPVGSRVRQR